VKLSRGWALEAMLGSQLAKVHHLDFGRWLKGRSSYQILSMLWVAKQKVFLIVGLGTPETT